jgi:hypothetical protein
MPLTALLAIGDGVVALTLLALVPRQRRNRLPVLLVASVLLGVAGWLTVLSLDNGESQQRPAQLSPTGPAA